MDDRERYDNGGRYVRLVDGRTGEDFTTLSVWLPETRSVLPCASGYTGDVFYVKDWSENEQIVPQLVKLGVIVEQTQYPAVRSGFVTAKAYRLDARYSHWGLTQKPHKSSDGYTFKLQPDWTWGDGDLSWPTYAEMVAACEPQ